MEEVGSEFEQIDSYDRCPQEGHLACKLVPGVQLVLQGSEQTRQTTGGADVRGTQSHTQRVERKCVCPLLTFTKGQM